MRVNNRAVRVLQGSGAFNVQASLDVRDLATMAEFLVSHGEIKEGKYGQIISWCFELGLTFLRKNYADKLSEYSEIEQALTVLKSMEYSIDQFKKGGNRQLVRGMANEAMQKDFGTGIKERQYVPGEREASTMDFVPAPSAVYVPEARQQEPKNVTLEQAIEAAQALFEVTGDKHPDFLWLWDKTIPDPRVPKEVRELIAASTTPEHLDMLMAIQEQKLKPCTTEEWEQKLRGFAIEVIIKNATSTQQVAVKPEIAHLVNDPDVIAEAQPKIQEWIIEREQIQLQKEKEKEKRSEFKQQHAVGLELGVSK